MKIPKGIVSHPAVKSCISGYDEGFDYKYNVELKDGLVFENGRNAGSNMMNFNTVSDFAEMRIVKVEDYEER